ncbi:hypothetical protein L9F63_008616, partial [Diploptera punctata]
APVADLFLAMERRHSLDDSYNDQALPIPIQIFLWRQISPFIRPKLGKLHEASCTVMLIIVKKFYSQCNIL